MQKPSLGAKDKNARHPGNLAKLITGRGQPFRAFGRVKLDSLGQGCLRSARHAFEPILRKWL